MKYQKKKTVKTGRIKLKFKNIQIMTRFPQLIVCGFSSTSSTSIVEGHNTGRTGQSR